MRAPSAAARRRRDHVLDPRLVAADRFELGAELGLGHAAGSDDLQTLGVAVEIGDDLEPAAMVTPQACSRSSIPR